MADLHFGIIMVNSKWKYFSLMFFGLLFWSFFFCPRDFGSHAEAPFAVTFMTSEITI